MSVKQEQKRGVRSETKCCASAVAGQDRARTSSSTPAIEYAACCFRTRSSSTYYGSVRTHWSVSQSLRGWEGQTDHGEPHSPGGLVLKFGIAVFQAPTGTLGVKMHTRIILKCGCLLFSRRAGCCAGQRSGCHDNRH